MSYVIRWVAMPSCSQRGSLIRSLIMERAAGKFQSPACRQQKKQKSKNKHQQQRTTAASPPVQTLVYLLVCCCLTATAKHQSTAIHSGQRSHLFITLLFLNWQGGKFSCHPGERCSPHTTEESSQFWLMLSHVSVK